MTVNSSTSGRTRERLRYHYKVEKELADRLRHASEEERRLLYADVYDELFRRVPDHPQLTRKADARYLADTAAQQLRMLKYFLKPTTTFLEVGAGDCNLAFSVAEHVQKVYGIDVSAEVTKAAAQPDNFELILSDGTSIPVPAGTIDVAYSNQLMEHLHPDDALKQLHNIYTALAPGGVYLCLTPNAISGPHDVSRFFDTHPTCFHLKEYTITELAQMFKQAGFTKVEVFFGVKQILIILPVLPITWLEKVLQMLPRSLRINIARRFPVRKLLNKVIGTK